MKVTFNGRNGKEKIIMITHKIITNDGYVVCECESLKEDAQCKAELIAIDKEDGTYEKGFYKIYKIVIAWLLA